MLVRILGSAAGGGFPQWNCGCENCRGIRTGTIRARARTQDSVAVSADGDAWFVLNAAPDILAQIEANTPLHPRAARHSPIRGIVLSNGDLDHVLGLFSLRESQRLALYASETVRRGLEDQNAIFRTLRRFPDQLTFYRLQDGVSVPLCGPGGAPSGLHLTALAMPGKRPLHLERSSPPSHEDNFGLLVRDARTGGTLLYVSAAASARALAERAEPVDCLLFDGTFFREDELVQQGLGDRRAAEMAHVPIDGPTGSLCVLSRYPAHRKLYTHINNTNPILREDSEARLKVKAAGWEIAFDGLEMTL